MVASAHVSTSGIFATGLLLERIAAAWGDSGGSRESREMSRKDGDETERGAGAPPGSARRDRSAAGLSSSVQRPTALVVDSHGIVRLVVALYLRQLGYMTYVAESGATALQRWSRAGPIDLLVTDVLLPGMTGSALAARLREDAPTLQVFYMSAEPEREQDALGPSVDRSRLLKKPFSMNALAAALATEVTTT